MKDNIEKVPLSPSEGQSAGFFKDGMPLAECIGTVVGIQVEHKTGTAYRYFGRISAVVDQYDAGKDEASMTIVYFKDADDISIMWPNVKLAVAEVAVEVLGD